MIRLDEIRSKAEAGRTVRITDVKYLLAEIDRLTVRAEKAETELSAYKQAIKNWGW